MTKNTAPNYKDVVSAASNIRQYIHPTPLLRSPILDEVVGGSVLVKTETLQRTGSFKFRGAFNKISRLATKTRGTNIVTWSSGNHAQAVAAAARVVGFSAAIIMPQDAPKAKIDGTQEQGGEVIFYNREKESREKIGTRLANEREATIVPPYDDPDVIAGQGTVGLEAASQALAEDMIPDTALIPCGGGGLVAGCSIALKTQFPSIRIHPVEPEGFDDTTRSLASGKRVRNSTELRSICDSLLIPTPGALTFKINLEHLAQGIVVTDDQVLSAMRFAYQNLKLVVEPGGAIALAALLADKSTYRNKTVLIILSGGNVDDAIFRRALSG